MEGWRTEGKRTSSVPPVPNLPLHHWSRLDVLSTEGKDSPLLIGLKYDSELILFSQPTGDISHKIWQ